MPLYELGVIIDPEVDPEAESAALERLKSIITDGGGTLVDQDTWGRRQLAYPIRKKNFGVYHFWKFEVGGEVVSKLTFELRTNDAVMRSLVLNLDNELRRKRKMDAKQEARAAAKAAKRAAAAEAEEA
ncbi:MAG TPA: 30S ribosomal protein S6 [Thermoanaerobaculales bacterium]|nr:30S ribosomal protein S6 [Thermoanaerobaculales bacterium]HPA81764.1 30S ribosomal protein S6 [Thermoanaerobaculales bacterium]HQL30524.1 30S ribosomal protein S6 [Thermoanaerobaculales bacterium]HQP44020.1 30S ribosomal protein S6 [Thermoanaerobaculales bacterium]